MRESFSETFEGEDLEKLFDETDDDMVMMAEDVQSCKNCTMIFLSRENLLSHEERCFNKVFRFNCDYCKRKFVRESHQKLHQKNCDKRKNLFSSSSKQRKLDEIVPGMSVVQVGGSKEMQRDSSTKPRIVESALNKMAVTYRIDFDEENRMDPFERLINYLTTFKPTIKIELEKRPAIKYYFTLKVVFHQSKDPSIITDVPVNFRTEVFPALNLEKLDLHNTIAMKQFQQRIDEFQRNGSGWVLNHFINVDIGNNNNLRIIFIIHYYFD